MSGDDTGALAADLSALLEAATDPTRTGGRDREDGGTIAPDEAAGAWRMVATSDHVDVETGGLPQKIVNVADWDGVLRHFGLDPAEFEVVDDTVRMSQWQQSKRTEDGHRDVVWLHSYKARFRRIQNRLPAEDVDALVKRVRTWKPLERRIPGTGLGAPASFHAGWSDWQLGKAGVAATVDRIHQGFERTEQRITELRRIGRNIEHIAIANMGDPIEGCYGNYDAQLHTIELNQRQQLNLALDLWSQGLHALAPLAERVSFISVLSNHSEWTRQSTGGKPVTGDSDNADGFLADTLRKVFADRPEYEHIEWVIPHDEFTVTHDLSGVVAAYCHGHKMPGTPKELDWLRAQSLRFRHEKGIDPRLWFTAHRHHVDVKDYGPFWRLQHPSQDEGSKWLTDVAGVWSTPGTLTCLVGEHEQAGGRLYDGGKGWSDLAVL